MYACLIIHKRESKLLLILLLCCVCVCVCMCVCEHEERDVWKGEQSINLLLLSYYTVYITKDHCIRLGNNPSDCVCFAVVFPPEAAYIHDSLWQDLDETDILSHSPPVLLYPAFHHVHRLALSLRAQRAYCLFCTLKNNYSLAKNHQKTSADCFLNWRSQCG